MCTFARKQHLVILALMIVSSLFGAMLSGAIAKAQSSRTQQTTQVSATIQKWEYRILQDRDATRLEREANRLGEQGYEIFAFQIVQPYYANESRSGDAYFVMVLKRPRV